MVKVLDIVHLPSFHGQIVSGIKMLFFLELVIVIPCMLTLVLGEGPTQGLDDFTISA